MTEAVPEWINVDFFHKILQNSKDKQQNNCEIKDFTVKSAAKKGEHIGGNVLRANINYLNPEGKSIDLSVIIKYLREPDNILDKKYETDLKIIETELQVYSEIIPKFEKMLRSTGDQTILGPRLLYHSKIPHKVIVLEDLTKLGYQAINNKMSDDEMIAIVVDKLAKWHACSYKLNYENNGCFESWDNTVFKVNEHDNHEFLSSGVEKLVEVLKKLSNNSNKNNNNLNLKQITIMLEKIQTKVYKKCTNYYKFSKTHAKLNVLNHGDFHCNNLMYKYDDQNKIQDIQIIDFALCFWGSMTFDLIYLLYAIYKPELRNKNRNAFIYKYFNKFVNTLKLIGFEGETPKLSDLLCDIIHSGHLELWLATTYLPFIYGVNQSNKFNIEEFIQQEDSRLAMYKIPEFLDDLQELMNLYLNQGFLDESFYDE